jgi:multisubunit Na+/H+ antiporter MnhC subunit
VIEAICVLIAIALCHRDQPTAAVVAMGLFATGVAACFLLIGAYDRPFVGQLAVTPSPLLQVMPEAARPIPSEASRPPNR